MEINFSREARKSLKRIPYHISRKFDYWLDMIRYIGILEARKYKGFHDEPLMGKRFGQRSVRLSKAYRIIYRETSSNQIEILEVTKHDY